ncbi:MAG: glucosyl transferase [Ignavibacterium sp.]
MKPLSLMPLLILIIQTLLFTTACKQSTEPKLEAELKLELEDASCTEAWIKLSATNLQFPATINLLKDGNVAQTISLWRDADTVLYVDSLLPNQTYKFKTIVQSSNQQINTSSNELTVTTMDTTSHEFSWQSWEFGTTGSSTLYDVAIIDENDIWAVGEINIADTSINGYTTYNAVHWDGTKWELKRIQFYTFCGQQHTGSYPAKSVFAFGSNDVWIAMDGSQVVRWNGSTQSQPICTPVSINKLWGSSSEDLYAVGNGGNIAHWDGRKWTKIENLSDVSLRDIKGYNNRLWISGYSSDYLKSILFELKNNSLAVIWSNFSTNGTEPFGNNIYSIYPTEKDLFIASNYGVFRKKLIVGNLTEKIFHPSVKVNQIIGTGKNDIFTVDDWSSIWHYNGITARNIYKDELTISVLRSADAKKNIFVAVGIEKVNVVYYKAKIIVSRRIN